MDWHEAGIRAGTNPIDQLDCSLRVEHGSCDRMACVILRYAKNAVQQYAHMDTTKANSYAISPASYSGFFFLASLTLFLGRAVLSSTAEISFQSSSSSI
jgi:hypothetical protein